MKKIFLVGNPNVGKTTLYNSFTNSNEHTGNWHGVTVDKVSKIVKFENEDYEFFDLPGLYSMNTFTMEEMVSKKCLEENKNSKIFYIIDASTIKRNLYLALQLLEQKYNLTILINNYDYFKKCGGNIDIKKLSGMLGCMCYFVNASNEKLNSKFFVAENNFNIPYDISSGEKDVSIRYEFIDKICSLCVKQKDNFVYGENKLDKFLLNKFLFVPIFLAVMFLVLYFTFFLVGPILSDYFMKLLEICIKTPFMNFINKVTKVEWIRALFGEGILSAGFAVLGFLPQIVLMYVFLSILENSGLLSRFAFMLEDIFYKIGLNGKSFYTMLMGFGCGTTATLTAKNMSDKNARVKTALLTPYMSCSAKLPVYTVVASSLFGAKSLVIILGLYLLGIVVAILMALLYEKTLLPSKNNGFMLEFPPMKLPNPKQIIKTAFNSAKNFVEKVFSIIFAMSVILWILTNFSFSFRYTNQENSMLFSFAKSIKFLFKPIGLNSAGIICALLVGLIAKELIISSLTLSNKVSTRSNLMASFLISTSAVFFTKASAISFLVFTLLYCPCISNIAVLSKEIGKKYTAISLICELGVAYFLSMIAFNIANKNFLNFLVGAIAISIIVGSVLLVYKKAKAKKLRCLLCGNCLKCNKCR